MNTSTSPARDVFNTDQIYTQQQKKHIIYVLGTLYNSGVENIFILTVPRWYFICGSSMFFFCLVFVVPLSASVYLCHGVTCWERADLLALICGV